MRYYKVFAKKFKISKIIEPFLNLMFNPQEALLLTLAADKYKTIFQLSKGSSLPIDKLKSFLNKLFFKGYIDKKIYKKIIKYKSENFITIFYQFLDLEYPKLNSKQKKYFKNYFYTRYIDLFNSKTKPVFKVIPVESTLEKFTEHLIIPYSKASEILSGAKKIAVIDCVCRKTAERFDKPLNVCLVLGKSVEFYKKRNLGRMISISEAQKILKNCSKSMLVHAIDNPAMNYPTHVICNCDNIACAYIKSLRKFNCKNAITKSGYTAITDYNKCNHCGLCIENCYFDARIIKRNKLSFIKENCFGCGLCIIKCLKKAIKLEYLVA